MNRIGTLTMTLLAGVVIGAIVVSGLHAQGKSPGAYVVIELSAISDPAAYGDAAKKAGAATDATGGRTIARSGNIISLHGTPPKRVAIVAFDNIDAAKAWADNPAVKEVQPALDKYSTQRRFIVEGM